MAIFMRHIYKIPIKRDIKISQFFVNRKMTGSCPFHSGREAIWQTRRHTYVSNACWHDAVQACIAGVAGADLPNKGAGGYGVLHEAVAGAVQAVIGAADGGDVCCGERFELACVIDAVFVGILPDRQASQLVACQFAILVGIQRRQLGGGLGGAGSKHPPRFGGDRGGRVEGRGGAFVKGADVVGDDRVGRCDGNGGTEAVMQKHRGIFACDLIVAVLRDTAGAGLVTKPELVVETNDLITLTHIKGLIVRPKDHGFINGAIVAVIIGDLKCSPSLDQPELEFSGV